METEMTLDELKQQHIDWYVNLLRIKKAQPPESNNTELNFQIAVQETKLHTLGISTENLKSELGLE